MKKYFALLGHQPHISLAELEIRYGADQIEDFSRVALLDIEPNIRQLGGSPKVGVVLDVIKLGSEANIFSKIQPLLEKQLETAERKVNIGISYYVDSENKIKNQHKQLMLDIKSIFKKVRFVPNRQPALNTAQVWHNKLLLEPNMELVIIEANSGFIIGQTTAVQNIKGYTIRDRSKPVRDAKNGMLPPKLAKSMLSLAHLEKNQLVLDPFCGTGTVLMEALLDGYRVIGSDLSDYMVEGTRANLDWLAHNMGLDFSKVDLTVGDAQHLEWQEEIDAVVSEAYLGPPLRSLPKPDKLEKIRLQVNKVLRGTLKNLSTQLKSGSRLVLAVPAWKLSGNGGYLHLPIVDELGSLGYNLVDLKLADSQRLIYHRPGQIVARQLLILQKG